MNLSFSSHDVYFCLCSFILFYLFLPLISVLPLSILALTLSPTTILLRQ
jgi:hypothetical protein